ncbi:MAG: hypothetical protein PHY94_03675, partial [Candidatus Omnitrophica bacterium]|nr:hypothetical protein [Candidatus Omnitrophota bacterium]
STRNAETNVMIKDGQTLVIGGLISENKIKYNKKVPILGDIPGLKYFFSKKEDTINRTELLIFITPHIVKEKDFNPIEIAKLQSDLSLTTAEKAVEKKKKKLQSSP